MSHVKYKNIRRKLKGFPLVPFLWIIHYNYWECVPRIPKKAQCQPWQPQICHVNAPEMQCFSAQDLSQLLGGKIEAQHTLHSRAVHHYKIDESQANYRRRATLLKLKFSNLQIWTSLIGNKLSKHSSYCIGYNAIDFWTDLLCIILESWNYSSVVSLTYREKKSGLKKTSNLIKIKRHFPSRAEK